MPVAEVGVLAALPLLFTTTLATSRGFAIKNAIRLLDGLVAAGCSGLQACPLAAVVRPP
jgi:hypothetical protein